jgi:hypothetical protein
MRTADDYRLPMKPAWGMWLLAALGAAFALFIVLMGGRRLAGAERTLDQMRGGKTQANAIGTRSLGLASREAGRGGAGGGGAGGGGAGGFGVGGSGPQ